MATTISTGSSADRSTQTQTQNRASTQSSISTPGIRTQRDTRGGEKTITAQAATLTFKFTIERVNPMV